MLRFVLIGLLFILGSHPIVDHAVFAQNESQSSTEENEFLAKLKKELENNKRMLADVDLGSDFPASLKSYYADIFKPLEYQIEKAEERIRSGLPFGEKEYSAAIKEVAKQVKANAQRRTQEADLGYQEAIKKSEDQYRRGIDESQRKFNKVQRKSDREYQLKSNAANLKFKFEMKKGPAHLVIWNLPVDRELHDRFTTGVNIDLYSNGKKVWSRNNVKLDRKENNSHIVLPKEYFDRVDIEISKWQGVGGGLSEIEVYLGRENVAANRPCNVSNSETVPRYLDDQHALTDGVRVSTVDAEGYWITEEDKKAVVSVDLIGELVTAKK